MSRKSVVVAVWKEKLTLRQSVSAAESILGSTSGDEWPFDIALAPNPFSYVDVARVAHDTHLHLCAQNVLWNPDAGSYIAETTTDMLCEIGCDYVIVGHSERRLSFGEPNDMIAKRALAAIDAGIMPILCVGETADERDSGQSKDVLKAQLQAFFDEVPDSLKETDFMVAYEPVWAISTWRTSRPLPNGEAVQELHQFVRDIITEIKDSGFASKLSLLYGGSVAPENAQSYMAQADVDGALVGGASKTPESFVKTLVAARSGFQSRAADR